MSCSSAESLFERFLDDGLTQTQRATFLTHLDGCADCRGILEELHVVDAVLLAPREVELAPNFTFAIMAEARTFPPPVPRRAPLRAYLVSYLVGAWLLAGAAMIFIPQTMHALAGTLLDIARTIADAVGGLGNVVARIFGRGGNTLTALLGALVVLDAALVVGGGFVLRFVRPRLAERLRS